MRVRHVPATLAALLAAPAAGFTPVATIDGPARVVDGDTLFVGAVEVRLQGIAAPEHGARRTDPGGAAATDALRGWAEGRTVRCDLDGTRTRGREVGVCHVDGMELNAALVEAGVARDCPRYSGGRYADREAAARAAGVDLSERYALPDDCRRR